MRWFRLGRRLALVVIQVRMKDDFNGSTRMLNNQLCRTTSGIPVALQ